MDAAKQNRPGAPPPVAKSLQAQQDIQVDTDFFLIQVDTDFEQQARRVPENTHTQQRHNRM
jgi:hypothetical protein